MKVERHFTNLTNIWYFSKFLSFYADFAHIVQLLYFMQVFQIVQLTNRSILITIETIEIRGITKHFIDKAKAITREWYCFIRITKRSPTYFICFDCHSMYIMIFMKRSRNLDQSTSPLPWITIVSNGVTYTDLYKLCLSLSVTSTRTVSEHLTHKSLFNWYSFYNYRYC